MKTRAIAPAMAVFSVGLVAGCASLLGNAIESAQSADGTIVIRGRYTESSGTSHALDEAMGGEAGKRCPSGWTRLSDDSNPSSPTGGRIWRVRCNPGDVSAAAPATAPPAPTNMPLASAAAIAAAAPARIEAPVSASSPSAAMSRDALVRMLEAAVKRASPYLNDSAAQEIVAEELRTLEGARIGVIGTDGRRLPLLPPP